MFVPTKVNECDFDQVKFSGTVNGAALLVRGATGRVCCVMTAGPEFIAREGVHLNTYEEAEAWAESVPGGYLDF